MISKSGFLREPDSNHRSLSYDQYPNGLKKPPELYAHDQPRCVRTREMRGRSRYPDNRMVRRGPGFLEISIPLAESQRVAAETLGLQAAQEVQEVLLLSRRELVKIIDDRVRLRGCEVRVPRALVRLDRLDEVLGSPVVKEKDALPQTPERCGPKLVALRSSLDDIVS